MRDERSLPVRKWGWQWEQVSKAQMGCGVCGACLSEPPSMRGRGGSRGGSGSNCLSVCQVSSLHSARTRDLLFSHICARDAAVRSAAEAREARRLLAGSANYTLSRRRWLISHPSRSRWRRVTCFCWLPCCGRRLPAGPCAGCATSVEGSLARPHVRAARTPKKP